MAGPAVNNGTDHVNSVVRPQITTIISKYLRSALCYLFLTQLVCFLEWHDMTIFFF